MSWGVNLDDLAAARDVLAEEVAEHPKSHPLEQLGHAHRWLDEESFAVHAAIAGEPRADHRTMLAAVGLLRLEPGPPRPKPPPDVGPQERGTLTLTYPHHSDGQVEPSVTVDERGDLHFLLHPARDLRVVLRQIDGRWQAIVGEQGVAQNLPGTPQRDAGRRRHPA